MIRDVLMIGRGETPWEYHSTAGEWAMGEDISGWSPDQIIEALEPEIHPLNWWDLRSRGKGFWVSVVDDDDDDDDNDF